MSEAVEYRVKEAKLVAILLFGLTISLIGFAMGAVTIEVTGVESATTYVAMVGVVWGVMFMSVALAGARRGYCRAFWKWRGHEYDYPPLDEWEEHLEEEGAFMGGEQS